MAEAAAVCEHLHLPLQSGSDRVLAAMHRGYTAPSATSSGWPPPAPPIPDLAVTTDIIVGFPGETDDDFERTLEVVAAAEYDSAYTFIFSPRPGTEAADMVDDFVPAEVVAERFERLRVVVERSALAKHQARVGRVEEVLVEGPSRKDPTSPPAAPARTSSCTSAAGAGRCGSAPSPTCASPAPRPTTCRASSSRSPHRPRHRTRIPVTVGGRESPPAVGGGGEGEGGGGRGGGGRGGGGKVGGGAY